MPRRTPAPIHLTLTAEEWSYLIWLTNDDMGLSSTADVSGVVQHTGPIRRNL